MPAQFTRARPSARYRRLIEQYRQLHAEGDARRGQAPEQVFAGTSLPPQAHHIRRLIERHRARSLLDYGCGKGAHYRPLPFTDHTGLTHPSLRAYWGDIDIRCYDPAYEPYWELPQGSFDGVIATDVLEHCPEEDMPWILQELFGYARRFVFANVACYPAERLLPSGGNAHCTVRPAKWWRRLVSAVSASYPAVRYEVRLQSDRSDPGKVLEG